ncbi:hypothetical protein ACL6C3_04075 [Capilliphycus salinus ALCB114379]|uniref:hypothetical protein n=1 Tax=Capilliphycus salinus TaxID=2768948 RepID=UPI0039A51160
MLMNSELTQDQVLAASRLKFLDVSGEERYARPMGYDQEEDFLIVSPEDRPLGQWEPIIISQVLELFD